MAEDDRSFFLGNPRLNLAAVGLFNGRFAQVTIANALVLGSARIVKDGFDDKSVERNVMASSTPAREYLLVFILMETFVEAFVALDHLNGVGVNEEPRHDIVLSQT